MKKHKLFTYLVPVLMLAFFARNIYLVENDNMDSWMGGGMRMFARVDKMLYRVAGFEVAHEDKTHFVNLRNVPQLKTEDVAARLMPSDERLDAILAKIRAMPWCYDPVRDSIYVSDKDCNTSLNPEQIKNIQVYRTSFDPSTDSLGLKPLHDAHR